MTSHVEDYCQAVDALKRRMAHTTFLFYQPIHIAEILHYARTQQLSAPDLLNWLDDKPEESRELRDKVTVELVGRRPTSSIRYQDECLLPKRCRPDCFYPPLHNLNIAMETNKYVEAYIYGTFREGCQTLESFLMSIRGNDSASFFDHLARVKKAHSLFRKASNKLFEIITYALCKTMLRVCGAECAITVPRPLENPLTRDFLKMIAGITHGNTSRSQPADIFRMGLTKQTITALT